MRVVSSFVVILALTGCGQERNNLEQWELNSPELIDSLERAQYCVVYAPSELEPELSNLIQQLKGTWTHYPPAGSSTKRREFHFDWDRSRAAMTDYYSLGKDIE